MAKRQTAPGQSTFDPITAGRLTAYVELGRSLTDACANAGVPRSTANNWLDLGRQDLLDGVDSERAEFARQYDQAKERGTSARLSEEDLTMLLEGSAVNGSVQATKLLLDRIDKANEKAADKPKKGKLDTLLGKAG